jgi:serine/threonine protein kinase
VRDSWAFAQAVGFRYSVQKSERVSLAAVAVRRDREGQAFRVAFLERVIALHDQVPPFVGVGDCALYDQALSDVESVSTSIYRDVLPARRKIRRSEAVKLLSKTATRKARATVPHSELFESVGGGDWFEKEHITLKHDTDEPTLGLLVRSVTPLGARRVYDLTVPGPHAFVANGVAVHNCMVMEIATRKSLFHVLNRDGLAIGWPQALEWGAQAAGGTACLHQHNIVHRDLKSLNLLVTQDWVIKVADFGLARFNNECFDAVDHQLLTSDGFLFLDEVLARVEWRVVNGRVVVTDWRGLAAATYSAKTAQLVYRQPLALGVNWGEQSFIEIGTEKYAPTVDWATRVGQHAAVSVVATGNHQMYVSKVGRAGKARQLHEFDKVALADLPSLGCSSVRMLAAPYGGVALDETAATAVVADDDMPLLDDLGANWRTELAPLQPLNLDREGAQPGGELLDEAAARAQVALFLRVFGYWLGDGSLVASVPHVRLGATKLRDVVFLRQALVKLGLIAIKDGRTAPLESDDDDGSTASRWWNDEDNFDCVKRDGVVQCWMSRANARGEKAHDIADERWAHLFATECESGGKRFPQWLLRKLSTKGLRNVVWGLHFADGQSAASAGRSTKERHVWTSSVLMRDQLEIVLVRAGFSVRTTLKAPTGSSPVQWCVSWAVEHVAEPTVQLRRSERDADAVGGRRQ